MSVLASEAELERSAVRRVTLRLVPFLIVCYLVAVTGAKPRARSCSRTKVRVGR